MQSSPTPLNIHSLVYFGGSCGLCISCIYIAVTPNCQVLKYQCLFQLTLWFWPGRGHWYLFPGCYQVLQHHFPSSFLVGRFTIGVYHLMTSLECFFVIRLTCCNLALTEMKSYLSFICTWTFAHSYKYTAPLWLYHCLCCRQKRTTCFWLPATKIMWRNIGE